MQKFFIFNTLSWKKEEFIPFIEEWKKDFVGFYSCGPTVYSDATIWNFRAAFVADLIRNVLKNILWYKTISVMNFTDVWHLTWDSSHWEDKMEKKSKWEWINIWDIAKKYTNVFLDWIEKLNIEKFDIMPKATDHVQEQIDMIKIIEKKWYTYKIPNDWIYMDTSKIEDYGKVIWPNYKKHLEWLRAWARVERVDWMKNITDFALWKFSPTEEKRQMEWDSPWWIGFPGWHIECSAMSAKYLWAQFDIHHGWEDHITIHHPNEIAQSEIALWIKPSVKYWIHNKFLFTGGKRMGKSEWNAYTMDDIEKKWFSGLDLRYFYLNSTYNSYQDFTWENLEQAKVSRINLIKKIAELFNKNSIINIQNQIKEIQNYEEFEVKFLQTQEWKDIFELFINDILDNINTPKLLSSINKNLNEIKSEYLDNLLYSVFYIDEKFLKLNLFNLILKELDKKTAKIPEEIIFLANKRIEAKQNKNWQQADDLRNEIENKWFIIKDLLDWNYQLVVK